MRNRCWIVAIALPVFVTASAAGAQGKGKGQGYGKAEQKQEHPAPTTAKQTPAPKKGNPEVAKTNGHVQNTGQARAAANREEHSMKGRATVVLDNPSRKNSPSPKASPVANVAYAADRGRANGRFAKDLKLSEVRPPVQEFVVSNRAAEYVTGGAMSYAFARGIPENALVITPIGRDVWVRNRKGDALLAIDDDRARDLGVWQVSPLVEPVREGAPSFCRSGAGHPVWGRQWCLQKGFGLGESRDVEWAAARDVGDLVFTRPVVGTLTREALLNLIGPVAFNRLALHALTLGYTDPLTGFWRSEPNNPGVLLVNSGAYPIAELVDENNDQRPELMLVALRPW